MQDDLETFVVLNPSVGERIVTWRRALEVLEDWARKAGATEETHVIAVMRNRGPKHSLDADTLEAWVSPVHSDPALRGDTAQRMERQYPCVRFARDELTGWMPTFFTAPEVG